MACPKSPVKHSLASFSPPPSSQHKKMASQLSQQYAFRAQKSTGLVGGTPTYMPIEGFAVPDVPARTYHYSPDGRLFAYALPTVVRIFLAEGAQLLQELSVPNIIELKFSPRGTYLSTWERPGTPRSSWKMAPSTRISASTDEELISFTQKSQENWDLQYTISESYAIRLVAQAIQVYRPAEWGKGIAGALAVVKIYGLSNLSGAPTCSKTFYKADRAQIRWNDLGTQALVLIQTEVDSSNMSHYGETGMYLLSTAGNFDCRITLDKEGPIHGVLRSPNSKEFGVVYGYMRAKTTLFDQRVRTLHNFESSPHNFISSNPQGRRFIPSTYQTPLIANGRLAADVTLHRWTYARPAGRKIIPGIVETYATRSSTLFGSTIPAAPQPSIGVLIAALAAKTATPKPADRLVHVALQH
ncbi:eukaryotic translation initiation factor eIF2A-domain-containing protein [Suillus discolor]|uniref:Eukaryotic translation initiation factor eIF2A-domain-containing protein n=1 Tax=Suillus discolor TaxID=1912936 RepID=A0A9P7EZ55_9AGAM|nr:eukaryotic translation initiation factor eIF2A-domain-containing protein [Suillus discolor]KAG2096361.1 eukaryotic translation initiation factor eIF2A-domain-containing protein [Suillus discolor]